MSHPAHPLTERDQAILVTLAEKVRCLSLQQIADYWWAQSRRPREPARSRLRDLESLGWVEFHQVFARPLIDLTKPLAQWSEGDAPPNFAAISHVLKNRFTEPARVTPVVIASRQTGKRYGCPAGRSPRRSEATHDLGLASVYLHFLRHEPARAKAWISEAGLIAAGEGRASKLADALLRTASGETVIEFGGEYGKAKLEAFHEDCAERGRSYELW
jgi:hypothetical protein